jgi:hypothetical protein
MSIPINRKLMQINQHFRWFLWSLAAYYFVSVSNSAGQAEEEAPDEFSTEFAEVLRRTSEAYVSPLAISPDLFQPELPESKEQWFAGFVYKNTYLRLAHYDSDIGRLIRNEVKSLKSVVLNSEQLSDKASYKLTPPMICLVEFGSLILYGTPVYASRYVERVRGGLVT